jgi:hypothetical protein
LSHFCLNFPELQPVPLLQQPQQPLLLHLQDLLSDSFLFNPTVAGHSVQQSTIVKSMCCMTTTHICRFNKSRLVGNGVLGTNVFSWVHKVLVDRHNDGYDAIVQPIIFCHCKNPTTENHALNLNFKKSYLDN